LTDKLTDLTGTVADAQGKLLNDYVVVLLPSGSAFTEAHSAACGRRRFSGTGLKRAVQANL